METKKLDVVYFVKESVSNEELRYSLRSIEKNLPHRKVWIYGGCPDGITPDYHVPLKQLGTRKYDRVQSMFRAMCLNQNITEDFILMNDDFFVMKKVKKLEPEHRGTLDGHIQIIRDLFGMNPYAQNLLEAKQTLEQYGCSTLSYELHTPMVMNRHKLLEILGAFPGVHATRTLYGNYHQLEGEQRDDVKVYEMNQPFDEKSPMLSTEDAVFHKGKVGELIRKKFTKPSRFEQ